MKIPIAIYFDLENIDKSFNVEKLMDSISENLKDMGTPSFAIKFACGDKAAIDKFEEQLKDLNFTIQDTPHVAKSNLKNRADLILSLSAFENFYLNTPAIKLYIFITSDSDFTVIADILRKYGKDVWLVTKKEYGAKKLFSSCADKILAIEDFFDTKSSDEEKSEFNLQEEVMKIVEHYREMSGNKPKSKKGLNTSLSKFIKKTYPKWDDNKKKKIKSEILNNPEMKKLFPFLTTSSTEVSKK